MNLEDISTRLQCISRLVFVFCRLRLIARYRCSVKKHDTCKIYQKWRFVFYVKSIVSQNNIWFILFNFRSMKDLQTRYMSYNSRSKNCKKGYTNVFLPSQSRHPTQSFPQTSIQSSHPHIHLVSRPTVALETWCTQLRYSYLFIR